MYTSEEQAELEASPHVLRCSSTTVTYTHEFKVWAVQQYYEAGWSSGMIFESAGLIPPLTNNLAKDCLKRWRKKYKAEGADGLTESRGWNGGRPKKLVFQTNKERIQYLEDKVAYLDAENDFLARLRGIKRE
jgi:hypothetical protein